MRTTVSEVKSIYSANDSKFGVKGLIMILLIIRNKNFRFTQILTWDSLNQI